MNSHDCRYFYQKLVICTTLYEWDRNKTLAPILSLLIFQEKHQYNMWTPSAEFKTLRAIPIRLHLQSLTRHSFSCHQFNITCKKGYFCKEATQTPKPVTTNVPHQIWLTGIQMLFFTKIITRENLRKGNLPQQPAIPFSENKSKILVAPICFPEGPNLRFSYDKDEIFVFK